MRGDVADFPHVVEPFDYIAREVASGDDLFDLVVEVSLCGGELVLENRL